MVDLKYNGGNPPLSEEEIKLLMQYCSTPTQVERLEAVLEHGTQRAAARALGLSYNTIGQVVSVCRKRAAEGGWTPHFDARRFVDPGQRIIGKSTFTKDPEGNPVWIKTKEDRQQQFEAYTRAISEAVQDVKPVKLIPSPRHTEDDLATVYTLTDYHLGAYAWGDETGADWDLKIAEELLNRFIMQLVQNSPDAEVGVFAQLGDLMHWDGLLAVTPTAKNILDADSRFPLLVEVAIRAMTNCVELMLQKHEKVHVIMAEGNHDMASSVWLRAIMGVRFRDNPRVSVDNSPFPYYVYEHGKCMLCWHHGHLIKMQDLSGLFASDPRFREMWGRCKYTYIHTGHRHQSLKFEKGGAVLEQHPTIAARDAHGARGFQISDRSATAITYHKERGEAFRFTVRA